MMRGGFDSVLDECLALLSAGTPVDECLQRYPRHADRLRPILGLADKVRRTPLAAARPGAQERAWKRVSQRAGELRAGPRLMSLPRIGFNYRAWVKPAAISVSLVLALSSFSGGVVYASQDALPDSPLYPVKLASEDVRLWFVFDETHKADILLDQSSERMDEILTMVRRGEPVPENALSSLHDRNERASEILVNHSGETALRARVLTQAHDQEQLLVALWPEVPEGSRGQYAEAVAHLHNTRLDGGSGAAFVTVRPEELTGGILDISGQAQDLGDGLWSVGGVEVRIDDRTFGRDELRPGVPARFVVARASNGRLHALSLSSFGTGPAPTGAVVRGSVEEVRDDGITVAGQFIPFSDDTFPVPDIRVGDPVRITLGSSATGVFAETVQSASTATGSVKHLTFEGTIEGDVSSSTSRWAVGGSQFDITASTVLDLRAGAAQNGARVQIEAENREGALQANRVTVISTQDNAQTNSIIGVFEGFDDDEGVWRISGLAIVPPEVGDDPPLDSLVSVDTARQGTDMIVTGYGVIESPDDPALVRFQGTIATIDNSLWTLEFGQVYVRSTARVVGRPDVGMRVIVWGERGVDGGLQARYVQVVDDTPVQALLPAPTVAPSATPAAASR